MIRVLWVDDEWEKQQDFIGEAEQFGVNVDPVDNSDAGLSVLDDKPDYYHAFILDAKVKVSADSEKIGLEGLRKFRDRLIAENVTRHLPYFILTGQPDYMEMDEFRDSYGEFYKKGDDNTKLFEDIIKATENHPEIQGRKEFPDAFEVFDLNILGSKGKSLYLDVLSCYWDNDFKKRNLNLQRDLFEAFLHSLNSPIPCLPDWCFPKNRPNHEWCTRFLEDRHTSDQNGNSGKLNLLVPKNVKAAIRSLKEETNGYSHLSEEEIVREPYVANVFLFATVFKWLPDFIRTNFPNYT